MVASTVKGMGNVLKVTHKVRDRLIQERVPQPIIWSSTQITLNLPDQKVALSFTNLFLSKSMSNDTIFPKYNHICNIFHFRIAEMLRDFSKRGHVIYPKMRLEEICCFAKVL